jgi:putative tryptophan/tyrosine transport system substrate-binding protein
MRRREFITLLGGAAAGWPLATRAQQPPMPVVGFIHTLSPENVPHFVPAFQQGLKEAGFVEGQNIAVEYRWGRGQYNRLPELAADLVSRKVAVIAALGGEPAPHIVSAATHTIPIVFASNGDPVRDGLVASLARPGGNVTGVTIFGIDAVAKRMQLLQEVAPQATVIGFLMNPNNPNADIELKAAQTAASSLGKELLVLRASNEGEIDAAFEIMAQQRGGALLGATDTFLFGRRVKIVSLAAHYRIPAIYYLPEFAEAGGLMAYGNRITEAYRQIGIYVGRILKGEKAADLPVVQATKYELAINLTSAKALGISIPSGVMAIADNVIE